MALFRDVSIMMFIVFLIVLQGIYMVYLTKKAEVKKNWNQYRCDPSYWIYSDNATKDMSDCTQANQQSTMGYMLQPHIYNSVVQAHNQKQNSDAIQKHRQASSKFRTLTAGTFTHLFRGFTGMGFEMQKLHMGVQDAMGKLNASMMALMYMMDGSNKTMTSAWKGPYGKAIRKTGHAACFHPDMKIKIQSGVYVPISSLKPGMVLSDGQRILATMDILPTEPLYALPILEDKDRHVTMTVLSAISQKKKNVLNMVYVTGSHYVWYPPLEQYIQVKEHPCASSSGLPLVTLPSTYSCLVTENHTISMGGYTFWDWEDDKLPQPTKEEKYCGRGRPNILCYSPPTLTEMGSGGNGGSSGGGGGKEIDPKGSSFPSIHSPIKSH